MPIPIINSDGTRREISLNDMSDIYNRLQPILSTYEFTDAVMGLLFTIAVLRMPAWDEAWSIEDKDHWAAQVVNRIVTFGEYLGLMQPMAGPVPKWTM